MKRYFYKKYVTAILFILMLFAFSILNLFIAYDPIKETWQSSELSFSTMKETIAKLENTINEYTFGKYAFIEAYGYMQLLMDKNEAANFEVVKDTEGKLHYSHFADQPHSKKHLTARVKSMADQLNVKQTKLTFVMPPDKFIRGYTIFPTGIPYHYNNETADLFLSELQQVGVDTVDLREGILDSGIPPSQLFFKTDHHWTIETAFWGFGQLVQHLNEVIDLQLDPERFYTDIENYNVIQYKDSYIGSMGRKVGKYYAGVDDFSLIYPKFKTDYDFYYKNDLEEKHLSGRFEDVLLAIYPLNMEGDKYSPMKDKYFTYLYGNQPFVHIKNKEVTDGPKVLFIKDSLAVPLISFLSTLCSDIYLIDPRFYKEDILQFVNETELDHVFISISPQDLVDEFFPFALEGE